MRSSVEYVLCVWMRSPPHHCVPHDYWMMPSGAGGELVGTVVVTALVLSVI